MTVINPQYDYDHTITGPLAALQARAAYSDQPYQIAPPIGWIGLVQDLDNALATIIPDYTIAQVKEKFATLCFYVGDYGVDRNDVRVGWAQQLIGDAEAASKSMCQICGLTARLRTDAWHYATLCDDHVNVPKWHIREDA